MVGWSGNPQCYDPSVSQNLEWPAPDQAVSDPVAWFSEHGAAPLGRVLEGEALAAVREAFASIAADSLGDPQLKMTGSALMFQDELVSLSEGMGLVGLIALLAVTVLLWLGLGSWRAVAALLTTLLVGLCWTATFASLAVGTSG